jgi:phosphoesterase RecJ-like protein
LAQNYKLYRIIHTVRCPFMQDLKTLTIHSLSKLLENVGPIVIVPHKNPDGDAIGSSLGLYHYLKSRNKLCTVIVNDAVPEFLRFLPDADKIMVWEKDEKGCEETIAKAGLICCLDYCQLHRSGNVASAITASSAPKIMVDHHPGPEEGFQFYYHQVKASSTSELVYMLINELEPNHLFSIDTANCLYTGLMTDTGCFRHALRPETFIAAAELIKTGISYEYLVSQIFDSNTEARLKLIGFVLNEKLKVLNEYRTAYISISFEESEKLGLTKGDAEGLVNYTLSIQNIVMGAFFHEKEKGKTKVSLRSKGNFAVNEISGKYFGGGGHKNAAGGEFSGTTDQTIAQLIAILPQYKAELQSLEIGKRD